MKGYLLQHEYEYKFNNETFEEVKVLGIYSTREKAEEAINYYMTLEGFKDHPIECFHIDEYTFDERHWAEGFFTE
jgi:hypothetical protein